MKKIIIIIIVIVGGFNLCGQVSRPISKYQYWFDNTVNERVTINVSPTYILDVPSIPVSNLSAGAHRCHFRVQDTLGVWSVPQTILFYNESQNIVGYQFWYDGQISQVATIPIPSGSTITLNNFDLSECPGGIHTMNYRFVDGNGNWSSPQSFYFFKAGKTITEVQYWIDDNIADAVSTPQFSESVAIDNLLLTSDNKGFHKFTIRFKDNMNFWSVPLVGVFFNAGNQNIIYEYWFDNNRSTLHTESLNMDNSPVLFLDSLDLSDVSIGCHNLTIRTQDNKGNWSSPLSATIFKVGGNITDYEYWLDGDAAHTFSGSFSSPQQIVELSMIDFSQVPRGVYELTIRFRDNLGTWSSPLTTSIFNVGGNITDYEYWLDGDAAHSFSGSFSSPQQIVELSMIDFSQVPRGVYELTIRFRDNLGTWSSPLTQEFIKVSFPIARFDYEVADTCTVATVSLTQHSIDADAFVWDFGDGCLDSATINPTHNYYQEGDYQISLTVRDTTTGEDSTLLVTISLHNFTPNVAIIGETVIAPNTSTILTATGAETYEWSTGETSTSILVTPNSDSTMYSVTGTNAIGCTASDTVFIIQSVGIAENAQSTISIYPNPTTDYVYLQVNELDINQSVASILDINGKKVADIPLSNAVTQVDFSKFEAGTYFIRIMNSNGEKSLPVIKR